MQVTIWYTARREESHITIRHTVRFGQGPDASTQREVQRTTWYTA